MEGDLKDYINGYKKRCNIISFNKKNLFSNINSYTVVRVTCTVVLDDNNQSLMISDIYKDLNYLRK